MKFAQCLSALTLAAGVMAGDDVGAIFDGRYTDSNHPDGFRVVSIDGELDPTTQFRAGTCVGSDTNPTVADYTLPARAGKNDDGTDIIYIDFSPKGGPKDFEGRWDTDGILFIDGNKWPKVSSSFLQ